MKVFRIITVLILSTFTVNAQLLYKGTSNLEDLEDYWEKELSPMTELNEIVSYIHNDPFKNVFISHIPAGNPLMRELEVNSFYGARTHPIHKVMKFHRGIDLQGKNGEVVISSGEGLVTETGHDENLGNFVRIKHKYGFESLYGHLSKITAKKGQRVEKGTKIGLVGSTGKVTGPHLHYTLKKNGQYLDPFDFLFMRFE
ncbi:M23 family metallopeptidase [Leadbetterella byssophila]|jgi:murein DD-endopeptidase MepM/ murein hydrolase activator NlpD|uniref:Peptidase M23 n=1 Tax=Leadbetterella byssophila (strain DSM 17132 / JCM 16389 / KACC 11308 / NBRC 106382 / 4M15) TaxID=649349 RepID=E4RVU2_LEAB4|nr:M23 family metallopeptidase [Leadbetterella byssophila]ADQ18852.1 Peptidase M23 [Leadbetterella byssophila DSM 17132]